MTPPDDDRPTLLLFGDGEPMLEALVAALSGRAIVMVEDEADSAVAAVLANVPDVTVFVGRAAQPEQAAALLRELGAHALTASSPVALLSSDDSLAARLRAAEHGVVTILQRSASADAMARQMLELATRLYDDPGVHEAGELAEASVDDLVQILGRELQSGILSITQADGARAERFVVRAGQPMRAAISQFIERVRPLIAEAKPLHYAFHEAPVAPLWTLDDEAEAEADGSARKGLRDRRFLLIANNPAAADALAQELRANGALVVVVSADGSGWDRARDLDPEIALIDEEGLNHWGFDAVARLRADPQLRWASLVVMDAKELLPEDGPPRVERLAANIAKLTEPDAALRARAAAHEVFDARIETVGPTRLVRALLSTGGAWNLQVRPRGGATLQLALAEGLVAGASAHLPDGRRLEAAAAFACLLVAGAGRLRAEPATHPKLANMLMPLDEAVRAAHAEGSPMPVTHSPSAPPPPPERGSRPSSPPRARAAASQTHSTETNALVGELEDLVGGLQDALEGQPTRPKGVARVAAPRPPVRPASAPVVSAGPTAAKPAPANVAPIAPKPAPTTAPKPAVGALAEPARAPAVPPRTASPATAAVARAAAVAPGTHPAAAPVASSSKVSSPPDAKPATARPAPPPSTSPQVATRAAPPGAPLGAPVARLAPAPSPASAARPPTPAAAAATRPPPPALAAAKSLPPPPPAAVKSLPPPPLPRARRCHRLSRRTTSPHSRRSPALAWPPTRRHRPRHARLLRPRPRPLEPLRLLLRPWLPWCQRLLRHSRKCPRHPRPGPCPCRSRLPPRCPPSRSPSWHSRSSPRTRRLGERCPPCTWSSGSPSSSPASQGSRWCSRLRRRAQRAIPAPPPRPPRWPRPRQPPCQPRLQPPRPHPCPARRPTPKRPAHRGSCRWTPGPCRKNTPGPPPPWSATATASRVVLAPARAATSRWRSRPIASPRTSSRVAPTPRWASPAPTWTRSSPPMRCAGPSAHATWRRVASRGA